MGKHWQNQGLITSICRNLRWHNLRVKYGKILLESMGHIMIVALCLKIMRFWHFKIANCLISDSVFSWIHVAFLIKDFLDLLNLGQVDQNTWIPSETNFCGFPIQSHPSYPSYPAEGSQRAVGFRICGFLQLFGRLLTEARGPENLYPRLLWPIETGRLHRKEIRKGTHGTRVWDDPNYKSQKSFRMSFIMFFFHLARLATFLIGDVWCCCTWAVNERYTGVPPKWGMGH